MIGWFLSKWRTWFQILGGQDGADRHINAAQHGKCGKSVGHEAQLASGPKSERKRANFFQAKREKAGPSLLHGRRSQGMGAEPPLYKYVEPHGQVSITSAINLEKALSGQDPDEALDIICLFVEEQVGECPQDDMEELIGLYFRLAKILLPYYPSRYSISRAFVEVRCKGNGNDTALIFFNIIINCAEAQLYGKLTKEQENQVYGSDEGRE